MTDNGKRLKNDDFRKLLSTPAHSSSTSSITSTREQAPSHHFTHKQTSIAPNKTNFKQKHKKQFHQHQPPKEKDEKDDIFNESQAKLNEILTKYRDRASERRKGMVPEDEDLRNRLAAAYKTAPNVFVSNAFTDRRKIEIQESKYLGGDIEHTYLVKGLDYSLLNKVRSEIDTAEKDKQLDKALEQERYLSSELAIKQANTKLAKNLYQILFESKLPLRNENFSRSRMAYIVELEDDVETDVPSTLLRSLHDCPSEQSSESVNTDNVLINKLTQILAYLRADTKKRKKGVEKEVQSQKIYEEASEYVSSSNKRDSYKREDTKQKDNKERPKSYFDSKNTSSSRRDERDYRESGKERDRDNNKRERDVFANVSKSEADLKRDREDDEMVMNDELEKIKKRRLDQEEAYSEFYPMGVGMFDAGGDSDDEADYSKMDMGNRKGPVKRWDFDNVEDYEKYQGQREAMPRAAYQFGVKMNAGRKTRKNVAVANEKKLDRELAKINKIMESRSTTKSSSKVVY